MQDIDIYYESLKQVYDQMVNWKEPKSPLRHRVFGILQGTVGVIFGLSVFPIIPSLTVYIGSLVALVIGPLDLSRATFMNFILVWISTAVATGIGFFFLSWLSDKIVSVPATIIGPPQTVSSEQLTFIAIYQAYRELKVYFVSHIDQHVDNSIAALSRVLPRTHMTAGMRGLREARYFERSEAEYLERLREFEQIGENSVLDARAATYRRIQIPSFAGQVSIAQSFLQTFEKYAWFQLDTKTKSILQGVISFPEKIPRRLKEREDLPAVLSVLENLSKFTYAFLPEHKTYMEPESFARLQAQGSEALASFVEEINNLTGYKPSRQRKEKPEITKPNLGDRFQSAYSHSVFLRFTLWFALILILTSGTVYVINSYVNLSPDAMATLVIGTSVASAAALAGFLPRSSKPE